MQWENSLASKQASKQAERTVVRWLSFAFRNLDNNSVSEDIQRLSFLVGFISYAQASDEVLSSPVTPSRYVVSNLNFDNSIATTINHDIKDRLAAVV